MKTHPAADIFPMLADAELQALAADIKENGQREPVRLFRGMVLDGRNRLAACRLVGVEPQTVEWTGSEREAWEFVWSENFHRRHLEKGQAVTIRMLFDDGVAAVEAAARAAVEARANSGRSEAAKGKSNAQRSAAAARAVSEASVPQTRAPQSRDAIAAKVGASPRTVQDALTLRAKSPKKFKAVAAGETSLKKAVAEVKVDEKRALAAELNAQPLPLPGGTYRVIAIDPPWRYDTRAEDASHRGKNQYPDMSIEELAALPVASLAEEDCVLWLWTTNAFMREAFTLLDAWGFKPKTILTWDKVDLGLGDWLRNVTEHCILAVRGRPLVTLTSQTTIIREKRREHSRKPDAFYALVEALCPGTKVEMFSRTPRDGWAAWGAETEMFSKGAA